MIEEILSHKRQEVAQRARLYPLEKWLKVLQPSNRDFRAALQKSQPAFLLECKKASPSQGVIRPDFDIEAIARSYGPFANAISVLTDTRYFSGYLGSMERVRLLSPAPILCKDFIVSPYQVYEARSFGADAVLLMLRVLSDEDFAACQKAAKLLHMGVLAEVHNEDELLRAIRLGADIIGVNNRDFDTLKVDLAVSQRLLPQIPQGILRIVESGIESHEDVRLLRDQCDGFLVGTSLMRAPNLNFALRDLIYGRVKVCGLTDVHDAQMAYEAGAHYGGLIFAQESERFVDVAKADQITQRVPLAFVGVFVNEDEVEIASLAANLKLAAVQLHGDENEAYVMRLRALLPDSCEIWKAIRVRDVIPKPGVFLGCDRLLLDSYHAKMRGGTGQSFDWSLLSEMGDKSRFILSGGLNPSNAALADAQGMFALDVNSGVEVEKAKKDAVLLERFFRNLREGTPA